MNPETESEALLEELRADLPSPERTERVRTRLLAAGVAVGTLASGTASAAGAAGTLGMAGATGTGPALWAAWGGLSATTKVAVSMAIGVAVGAGPLWVWQESQPSPNAGMAEAGNPEIAPAHPVETQPRRPATDLAARQPLESVPVQEPPASALDSAHPAATVLNVDPHAQETALERVVSSSEAKIPERRSPAFVDRKSTTVEALQAPGSPEPEPPLGVFEPSVHPEGSGSAAAIAPALTEPEPSAARSEPRPNWLAEEIRLIDRAFTALRVGDFARAERSLAEHQRRFPTGHLVQERDRAHEKLERARRESEKH